MTQLDCASWATTQSADTLALHSIAVATELLLKSHLLRTASTDAWNRVQIGHNLDKAARYAERAGRNLPSRLALVVDQLHPYFQRGGFQRDPRAWPAGLRMMPVTLCVNSLKRSSIMRARTPTAPEVKTTTPRDP